VHLLQPHRTGVGVGGAKTGDGVGDVGSWIGFEARTGAGVGETGTTGGEGGVGVVGITIVLLLS